MMNDILNVVPNNPVEQRDFYNRLFRTYESMLPTMRQYDALYNAEYYLERDIDKIKNTDIKAEDRKAIIITAICSIGIFSIGKSLFLTIFSKHPMIMAILCIFLLIYIIKGAKHVYSDLYKKPKDEKRKNDIITKEAELTDVRNQMEICIAPIRDKISLIPRGYRTTDAVEYFCNAYSVGKAESLKEAMLQYDEESHRRRMEKGQQELHQKQQDILNNQVVMQKEISLAMVMAMMK